MAKVIAYALILSGYAPQVGYAILAADSHEQARRQRRRAIAQYNEAMVDRLEMVDVSPDQPRTIAMGRVRTVEGVRRRWVSGANDEKLTMVVSLAGHEIDAIEKIWFNDIEVTLDGSGYVLTAPFLKQRGEGGYVSGVLDGAGAAVLVAAQDPVPAWVEAVWRTGEGEYVREGTCTVVSVVGNVITLSAGEPGATVYVHYLYASESSTARVRSWLGAAGQNVGADIAADYPGEITSADQFAGMAVLVVDIDYDPDVYPTGRPNVTALIRGAKIYDPRLDGTVAGGVGLQRENDATTWTWSENSALCAYHYARHANGWAVPAVEIMAAADVATEADECDVSTDFTLRKPDTTTSVVTLPRYRCGMVVSTAADPRESMNELLESMAGRAGWAGGVWRFRAGRAPAAVFDLDESWLARRTQGDGTLETGPTLQFTNGVPREQKLNRVTGTCVDPDQRYQGLPFPGIEDAVLIAADGVHPLEVEYQAVNHIAHAQHLASVAIRSGQASLRLTAECNLRAYPCELFDVGAVTLPAYGIHAKAMEVVGWRWAPRKGAQLRLREITPEIYAQVDELVGRDPAPNTNLPNPWDVETPANVAVTSGTVALRDGSIVARLRVTWDRAVSQAVLAGGRAEVQFRDAAAEEWQTWEESGGSVQATIPGVMANVHYVVRVRFVTAAPMRVRGDWSTMVLHLVAETRQRRVYRQAAAPSTDLQDGDEWFDTDDGNRYYVRELGAWVEVLVGTGGMEPGAATVVYPPLTSTSALLPIAAGGLVILSPRTLTPSFDCTAEVSCSFDGESQSNWDIGGATFAVIAIESADTTDDGDETYTPVTSGAGERQSWNGASSTRASYTLAGRFDLSAGVEYRLGLLMKGIGPTPGPAFEATCYSLNTSVTLVLR